MTAKLLLESDISTQSFDSSDGGEVADKSIGNETSFHSIENGEEVRTESDGETTGELNLNDLSAEFPARDKAEVKLKVAEFQLKIVQTENIELHNKCAKLNAEMDELRESNANLHHSLERLIEILHVHAMTKRKKLVTNDYYKTKCQNLVLGYSI